MTAHSNDNAFKLTDAERRDEVSHIVQELLAIEGSADKMLLRERQFIAQMIDRSKSVTVGQLIYARDIKKRYCK